MTIEDLFKDDQGGIINLPIDKRYGHPHRIYNFTKQKYRKKEELVIWLAPCECGYAGGKIFLKSINPLKLIS